VISLRLAKVWSCHPDMVLKTRIDLVIDALHYEVFLQEHEETSYLLNREERK